MPNENSTAPSPAELLLELKALVTEAETLMAKSLSGHSANDYDSLRERVDSARDRLGQVCIGARSKVAAGARCADEAIRANPYESLAIAAGVGLLVGGVVGTLVARRNANT